MVDFLILFLASIVGYSTVFADDNTFYMKIVNSVSATFLSFETTYTNILLL